MNSDPSVLSAALEIPDQGGELPGALGGGKLNDDQRRRDHLVEPGNSTALETSGVQISPGSRVLWLAWRGRYLATSL
jgi:hypothetical protein